MQDVEAAITSVAIFGAGSWGTTFAKVLADAAESHGIERSIRVWGRNPETIADINGHRNGRYLGDIELPSAITATTDPAEALAGAQLVVFAVPAQSLRAQLERWRALVPRDAAVMSLMKGLEVGTDLRMSEVIAEVTGVPTPRIAVLSGPNLAMEIARKEPTASVIACADEALAQRLARASTAPYFRPYTSTDVVGAEIGGIVKNVIALCVGICDGRGMGDNTKASVITRGLAETTRLAVALGADPQTLAGLAGLGDLVATCASKLSRNHTAGTLLGQGLSVEEVGARMTQIAEGIKSAPAVRDLARRVGVDMPITEAVVGVLAGRIGIDQLQTALLARELKSEGE
ncbi:NAD(P)H-dependent glycerol-3-phosphate dehydrogenase [Sinomonas sp. ASV322]|uniref:NAD(P)H-dependent glycerol-3-phosphate dehydrogenase n=1 Tax=Sinomonas sp. ASV322 TaxID=3041920 RepID=UPI0027DC797F|nr:NAD(P)H-dependent glycerol-3-phosphate dehydrogenase [Sinomonas sp. ASV322]MDQ4502235.1 NAD(P)H-dependent glycerol-3-phosphate dehydrogenase [Sinomonas sp. ASV322]